MDEQTEEGATTDQKLGQPPQLDINEFTPEERVSYIMDIRRRVDADPTQVTDDEIRNAVCCIRIGRADVAKTRRSKKDTPPKTTLADF